MRKNYVFLSLTFLFLSFVSPKTSTSQPGYLWAVQTGGTLTDAGKSVAIDTAGNIYTAGSFQGIVDFDPSPNTFNMAANNVDVFITKTDAAGQFIWARKMGGTGVDVATSIVLDITGNVYTTGSFTGMADFDPGAPSFTLSAVGNTDVFISKLSVSGDFAWVKQLGGSDYDYGNSISKDASGNIYACGNFRGTADFNPATASTYTLTSAGGYDAWLVKLNSFGDYMWAKQLGGAGGDFSNSLSVDNGGNVAVSGWFEGVSDFDPSATTVNLTSAGLYDAYACKLDAFGNYIWARRMGGANSDEANAIALDASGNVCIAGWFSGTADFDPGAATHNVTSFGGVDIFIMKLSSAGNFVWADQLGGTSDEVATGLCIDAANAIYATGYFNGAGDLNPGPATNYVSSNGMTDIFVCKLTATGNFSWAGGMGGNGADVGSSLAVDPRDAFVYVTGKFQSMGDFNPLSGFSYLTSAGGDDIFLVKLCQAAPDAPLEIFGNDTICEGSEQVYFIDPVPDALSYTWILPNGSTAPGKSTSITVHPDSVSGNLTVRANNDCGSSSTALYIKVNKLPDVHATVSRDTVCSVSMPLALSGIPAGGIFAGPGVNGTDFHPILSGPGLQLVTYTMMDSNECSNTDTLSIFVDVCVGMEEVAANAGSVQGYPNPASDQFTVESAGMSLVEIFSVSGQKVSSEIPAKGAQKISLDVSTLTPGIYFVKVTTAIGVRTLRLMKEPS